MNFVSTVHNRTVGNGPEEENRMILALSVTPHSLRPLNPCAINLRTITLTKIIKFMPASSLFYILCCFDS